MYPTGFVSPLLLIIRFSTSQPDVELDITAPQSTTVLSLKNLLRNSLDTRNRLRLIHQGRLLPDAAALSAVIKPLPPPPSSGTDTPNDGESKGKGKAVAGAQAVRRIYINCSIGDELTDEELAAEREAADKPPDEDDSAAAANGQGARPSASTRPRPRGFDRFLQAGFSSTEVATLRTQFASVHRERATPDSMPSPDTMRNLEDAWIDTNAGDMPSMGGAAAGMADEDLTSGMASMLDTLIRAMVIGFFFPLGSLTWLLHEGIFSEKWRIFVGSGVVFSITVGIIKSLSGDQ